MRARFHVILALLLVIVAPALCRAQKIVVAPDGKLFDGVIEDGVHLSDAGYQNLGRRDAADPDRMACSACTGDDDRAGHEGARSVHE